MPPPTTLPDELLEEIFIRLPPNEPACLVCASLASKLWLALLTGPAFRSRYAELHGAPPMMGFLLSWLSYLDKDKHPGPHFVSTSKFGALIPEKSERGQRRYDTLDCRHGRVLLAHTYAGFRKLALCDSMTDDWRVMDAPDGFIGLAAAVLCAVAGCDHRGCHEGPFRVLFFGLSLCDGEQHSAHAWVCSSQTEDWTQPCSPLQLGSEDAFIQPRPSLLFQHAIYHKICYTDGHIAILKYDIGSDCMSPLDGPPLGGESASSAILMAMEDDSLGFTYFDCLTLYRWSRQIRSDGVATWTQHSIVDCNELLPIQNLANKLWLIGYKEGSSTVFVSTDLGIYEINLKSLEWKKLCKGGKIRALFPYMTFYNPSARATPM